MQTVKWTLWSHRFHKLVTLVLNVTLPALLIKRHFTCSWVHAKQSWELSTLYNFIDTFSSKTRVLIQSLKCNHHITPIKWISTFSLYLNLLIHIILLRFSEHGTCTCICTCTSPTFPPQLTLEQCYWTRYCIWRMLSILGGLDEVVELLWGTTCLWIVTKQ